MTAPVNSKRTISLAQSLGYFTISLVINSLGNVLTLISSDHVHPSFLGSAYWTAADADLGHAFLGNNAWVLFWAFFGLGVFISFLNALLLKKLDWKRIGGNIAFMLPFLLFIQWFANLFESLPQATSWVGNILYVLLNFFGVFLIGTAISIYQRVNLVLHSQDDLFQIIRFKYVHGNATVAMWLSYLPPTVFGLIAFLVTGRIDNIGIGTIFAFLFQGSFTGWADKHVFPKLKHQALDMGN
ncbi:fructose permease [Lactobacillus sp. 3B(2020)]|uniref:fructose permease n=1 Tax=Lactobacillus sp. 3B(2020) TaxID=2695882 RepID=UPI0015DEF2D6|nr:fructose permease [Lactobacillus sp. 3B(2020)]QLL69086.1 fructose permease [Lactobacillus sp. 3B(2020)]